MALLNAYRNVRDIAPAEGVLTLANANHIQIVADPLTINFYGSFVFDGDGFLVSGLLQGTDLWDSGNGGLQYEISGLNHDALTALTYVLYNDPVGLTLFLYGGDDTLNGYAEDDILDGFGGADLISGGAGNDLLDAGDDLQTDTLVGGTGDDQYVVDGWGAGLPDQIVEAPGEGRDSVSSRNSYVLPANVENLQLIGLADSNATGNALANLLTGNTRNNLITGEAGSDTLDGGGGMDTLWGGSGDDLYVVESGDEVLQELAGEGRDTVLSPVSFLLGSEFEILELTGNSAIDGTGNALDNLITGNAAGNVLDGGAGIDTLQGGVGDDTYLVDSLTDVIMDASGNDTIRSSVSGYALTTADVENLVLTGAAVSGSGNAWVNQLTGNALDNLLDGGGGNDTLDGGAGLDTLIGGAGDDVYRVDSTTDTLVENADGGFDTILSSVSWTLGEHFENLTLADSLNVTTGPLDIDGTGNPKANRITGNAGRNVLDGGAGADTLDGGDNGDIYIVDDIGDVVHDSGLANNDEVRSSVSFDLRLAPTIEDLRLTGAADIDATGNEQINLIVGNGGRNVLTAIGGDRLEGGAGDDTLIGSVGSDALVGGPGADLMSGGAGSDYFEVDDVSDVVVEIEGDADAFDHVVSFVNYVMPAHVEVLSLGENVDGFGTARGGEVINGGYGANRIHAGGGQGDRLYGRDGDDTLYDDGGQTYMQGGYGNDTFHLTGLDDTVEEFFNEGIDTVVVDQDFTLGEYFENLTLLAGQRGTGNAADNLIIGNAQANWLDGGAGVDTLQGGAGDDWYGVDHPADRVIEVAGDGFDTVESHGVSYSLAGTDVEVLLLGDNESSAADGTGNALDNLIRGTNGPNRIDGGAGADTMAGLSGDDSYGVDHPGDRVSEQPGDGIDTVRSQTGAWTLDANLENLVLLEGAQSGTGNSLANVITGNPGDNLLDGGAGDDWIDGDAGQDTAVYPGVRADYMLSQANGRLTVSGAEGLDVLTGIDALRFADETRVLNAHLASGEVRIFGETLVRQVLSVDAAGIADEDGVGALSYQWYRGDVAIAGATSDQYYLGFEDGGAVIRARVRFVDGAGNTETLWSPPTPAITELEKIRPVLVAMSPNFYQWDIDIAANLVLTFNEPITRGTGTIVLATVEQNVLETFDVATSDRITISGQTLTLDPTADFPYARGINATFDAASVMDLAGNAHIGLDANPAGTVFVFRTEDPPDQTGPVLSYMSPWGDAVPVYTDHLFLYFNEPVIPGIGRIVVETTAGAVLETFDMGTSPALTVSGMSVAVQLGVGLDYGTAYRVKLSEGVLRDAAGNGNLSISPPAFTTWPHVISGTEAADPLSGDHRNDILMGLGGDDTLAPGLGNDSVDGGDGVDTVVLPMFPNVFSLSEISPGQVSGSYGTSIPCTLVLNDVEFVQFGRPPSPEDTERFQTTIALGELVSGAAQLQLGRLTDLYLAFFGRAPDVGGLEYWQEKLLEQGRDFATISKDFAWSLEAQALFPPAASNGEFVRTVYLNCFGREPDPGGWDYWTGRLDGLGVTDLNDRGAFVGELILGAYAPTSGEEDRSLLTHRHDAAMYYVNRLSIMPAEGFDAAINALLTRVTGDAATEDKAEAVIDHAFANPITLTGIMADPVLLDSIWGA